MELLLEKNPLAASFQTHDLETFISFLGFALLRSNHFTPIGSQYSDGPRIGHEYQYCSHPQLYPQPVYPIE